jgi:PAS domain S-box-containing protein
MFVMQNVITDQLVPGQLLHSTLFYVLITNMEGKCVYANPLFQQQFGDLAKTGKQNGLIGSLAAHDIKPYQKAIALLSAFPEKPAQVKTAVQSGVSNQSVMVNWEISLAGNGLLVHIGFPLPGNQPPLEQDEPGESSLSVTKLKELVNHLPGAVYRSVGDEHLSLVFFSDEIEKITGYPMDYFLNNRKTGYSSIVHKEDVAGVYAIIEKAIGQKTKYEMEYRIVRKDGQIRWVFESGKAVYDEDDNCSYIDGYIFDNTERKEIETTLATVKDELKRLALVAHNTTNSVMIADADESIVWVNEGYTRISGYSLEEVKGKKIGYSLSGPGFSEEKLKVIRSRLDNRLPYKDEFVSHTKTGEQIWLEVDCHPLQDETGKHLGFMAIETDITQRKKILKEQAEMLQRLTLATDSAEIGIFEIDLITNEVIWDDRMYELYGFSRDTSLSLYKVFGSALHPDDAAMMNRIIQELISMKKEINGAVYRIFLPNGTIRYIESHAIIKKSESGRILSLIGTNRDVTEAVLVQEKIKTQNKVLRDIAFIQSHEVRKPLANILGILEILHQSGTLKELEILEHLTESARELDQQIRQIVNKANEMDDDIFR